MSSPYYTPSGTPATNAQGSSSDIRSEFAAIETAMDKLPALTADNVVVVNSLGTALIPLSSLTVSRGGTGASTLTDGGVLLGSGTGAITALGQPTNGQLVIGSTGVDPVLATLTAGTGISIVEGAGSITITNDGVTVNNDDWSGTDLSVANGGTGASSLTDGGVLLGSGTGAITALGQPTNGQLVIGSTGGDPVLATLTAGTGISIVEGAGTITITNDGGVTVNNDDWDGTDLSVANGGTGVSTLTDGGVLLGSGTGAITALGQPTNGQLVIGSTGVDPVLATLTAGTGISIVEGAGTITITNDGVTVNNDDWSGTDLSVANGGTGVSTLTDGGVLLGSGTGAITALGQPTNGQLVIGSTGVDPVLATLTAGTGISIVEGAGSITITNDGGTVTSVSSAGTVNGLTLTGGPITSSGTLTLGGTLAISNADWSGTDLSVANGGTGASTLTDGGVLLGSGTGAITAMAVLADGEMIVGDGTTAPVAESGATLRTSIGLGTADDVTFAGLTFEGDALRTEPTHSTNTRLGWTAGASMVTGAIGNTAVGSLALTSLTIADNNTAVGSLALRFCDADRNTAVGGSSLTTNVNGIGNTAVGYEALRDATLNGNTAVGEATLKIVSTGESNTAVGREAGGALTTGSFNTFIGRFADTTSISGSNRIAIGYTCDCDADNRVSIGKSANVVSCDFGTDAVWTRASDINRKQDINDSVLGLDFINDLRPVTYRWKEAKDLPPEWGVPSDADMDTETVMTGLIAQEVEAALIKANIGVRFPGWSDSAQGQRVSPDAYIFPLINAVKELTLRLKNLEEQLS